MGYIDVSLKRSLQTHMQLNKGPSKILVVREGRPLMRFRAIWQRAGFEIRVPVLGVRKATQTCWVEKP